MNALVTIASPNEAKHTIFSPRHQAAFLENLSTNGNVRLACRAARVSPQTAYRARRSSTALARAWDAALLAARHVAEEVLADRALNGVEESVFYHGEEIATRRRYDSRLLLAHLARLDKLAEREDVADALPLLDEQIEGLRRGEGLDTLTPAHPEPVEGLSCSLGGAEEESTAVDPSGQLRFRQAQGNRKFGPQDPVPCVPSCMNSPSSSEAIGQTKRPSSSAAVGQAERPCPECGGLCETPGATLGPEDCMWLGNRLDRMDRARPRGALPPHALCPDGDPDCAIETAQLLAFEAGEDEWWLLVAQGERGGA